MKIFSFFKKETPVSPLNIIYTRFPLAGSIVIICTVWLLYLINAEISGDEIGRAILICGTVFFFSLGVSLFTETIQKNKYTSYLPLVPLVYGAIMYFTDAGVKWDFESTVYLILHLAGFIGFIFIAPYIVSWFQNKENEITYTNYFSMTSWALFMADIVGVALLVLGIIGITSVIELFDLNNLIKEDKIIANWAVLSLAFVAPLYALIHMPRITELETRSYQVHKFFGFLIRFVGVPFIYLYFIILYAYSIRVLADFSDWPNGMISWMVIGFSAFGYLNYIFSKAYQTDSKHVSLFRKYFPLAVLPQTVMLFYAIYLRINQYDITMNRYFVVIFGVWLVIVSLYLLMSNKKSMSLVPASLALISFVISVGPWSVFHLPLNRQYDRLVLNLEKANILKNGVITPLKNTTDIDANLSRDIASGIEYVCGYSDCQLIRDLFPEQIKNIKYTDSWNISSSIAATIKVQQYHDILRDPAAKYLRYQNRTSILPLELETGYNKIVTIYSNTDTPPSTERYPYITINPDSNVALYHRSTQDIVSIPFVPPANISEDALVFTIGNKQIRMKLFFQFLSVKNPQYTGDKNTDQSYYISGMALVQDK